MSKSSERYRDPLYSRKRYAKYRKHILEWRQSPEQKAKQKAYREAHPEKFLEAGRRYRERNREKLRDNWRKYRRPRPATDRRQLLKKYGLTDATYAALLTSQHNQCAICASEQPRGRGRFHVDHCHATKKVRGLLCNNCNTALGLARDNPAILFAAANYLLRHQPPREVA
jgi:hypothetical protein